MVDSLDIEWRPIGCSVVPVYDRSTVGTIVAAVAPTLGWVENYGAILMPFESPFTMLTPLELAILIVGVQFAMEATKHSIGRDVSDES